MARNVEIKARVKERQRLEELARAVADTGPEVLVQEDTFFCVPRGRLKLREFGDGTAELIQYERPDTAEAKLCNYRRLPVPEPGALKAALADSVGIRAVVCKRRTLYFAGPTRIHLDEVEGLGDYLELEVVLKEGQSSAEGQRIADGLMAKLEITSADLVEPAYVDLLERAGETS